MSNKLKKNGFFRYIFLQTHRKTENYNFKKVAQDTLRSNMDVLSEFQLNRFISFWEGGKKRISHVFLRTKREIHKRKVVHVNPHIKTDIVGKFQAQLHQ